MKRLVMLLSTGVALLGLVFLTPGGAVAANPHKVLYFTRSAGYEHSAVKREGDALSISERVLTELGKQRGIEVVCTKDGRVFDGDLDQYDALIFYTSGDLTQPNKQGTPPMTAQGKQRLLDAVAAGKGFVGIHAATDTFRSEGDPNESQTVVDPYIAMIGGEFINHGKQQVATMQIISPQFPGLAGQELGDSFSLNEEWYAMKNYADDLHVILRQQTDGMEGECYQRPSFPATWARMHGQGRVWYTSLGHRHDVWDNPIFQKILLGGMAWAMGDADADVAPNVDKVTPGANQLRK